MAFIIRNRGFFYTDEYYAPIDGVTSWVNREVFDTRQAAVAAVVEYHRKRLREGPLSYYIFDAPDVVRKLGAFLEKALPDEYGGLDDDSWFYDFVAPDELTDEQLDEILEITGLVFAQVFEVDEVDELDEDDEDYPDDLHFG